MSDTTRERRGRPVTHQEARIAARRLIDSHFRRDRGAKICIPAEMDDDDILIHDYITEQEQRA
jgi:hypothetical protein